MEGMGVGGLPQPGLPAMGYVDVGHVRSAPSCRRTSVTRALAGVERERALRGSTSPLTGALAAWRHRGHAPEKIGVC